MKNVKSSPLTMFGLVTDAKNGSYEDAASPPGTSPEVGGNIKPLSSGLKLLKSIHKSELIDQKNNRRKDGKYPEKGPQSKNWTFTNFDFTDIIWYDDTEYLSFIAYGIEVCPATERKHHQGFLQFKSKKCLNWIKNHFSEKCCFFIMRGSFGQNTDYCSKEGAYTKRGEFSSQGQQTPLNDTIKLIKDRKYDIEDDACAVSHVKYNRGIKDLLSHYAEKDKKNESITDFNSFFSCLSDDQSYWLKLLKKQDRRSILWIVDFMGGIGKSVFSQYLNLMLGAFEADNCAGKDLAFAYAGQPYVAFDFERTNESVINYGVIEKLKNGKLFSAKYESCSKRFVPPKIIVFSNFKPDLKAFSMDRWHILTYKDRGFYSERIGLETKFIDQNIFFDSDDSTDTSDSGCARCGDKTCNCIDINSIVFNDSEEVPFMNNIDDDVVSIAYDSDDYIDRKH